MKKKLLFIELLLCVAAAWFIFSVQGFLPRLYSLPIPQDKQKYNSPFYVTGNSYVNRVIVNYRNDTVEPGIMEKLDVFNSNNIDASRGYYDRENDRYYIANRTRICELTEKNLKKKVISDVEIIRLPGEVATPVKYNSLYFKLPSLANTPRILGGREFVFETTGPPSATPLYHYDFFRDEKGQMTNAQSYNFKGITQLLNTSETENISLEELSFLLWITRNRLLLGWYPETGTAVFAHYDETEGQRYITRYTMGSEEPEHFPLALSSDTYFSRYDDYRLFAWDEAADQIYLYDFVTGERQDIVQAPDLTVCRYRIRPDKQLLIAGITTHGTVWSCWGNGSGQGELEIASEKGQDITIGTDGFCLFFPEDGSYGGTFYSLQQAGQEEKK